MEEESAALEALQQALKQEFNGDAEASEQDGQPQSTVNFVPRVDQPLVETEEKDSALTNKEAKHKRISDAEWQESQETKKKAQSAQSQIKKIEDAVANAPEEVKQEEDLALKFQKLQEMLERKDWEAEHPVVKKYPEEWAEILSKKGHLVRSGDLNYNDLLKLINKSTSRIKEEYESQKSNPSISQPMISRGTMGTSDVTSMTMDILRKAGYTEKDMVDNGLKL